MKIPAAGKDHKFVVFGAVDYASGQLIWEVSATKDGEAFAHFLDHLAASLPDEPIIVVLDNASYHKGHLLREHWQRLADRITPYWLPAYASQLNLIERLWRWLKAQLRCHRWWHDMSRLIQATNTLLASIMVQFHRADGPSFQLVHNFCRSA